MPPSPRDTKSAATRAAIAVLATGAWLLALDRAGMWLADLPAWCGLGCTARLGSLHVAASLAFGVPVLLLGLLLSRLRGALWYVTLGAGSAAVMLVMSALFSAALRSPGAIAAQPFMSPVAAAVASVGGVAVAIVATLRRRAVFPYLLAGASILVAFVDTTIYPGQSPAAHLGLYYMQASTSLVGVGLPVADRLSSRERAAPVAFAMLAVVAAFCAHVWSAERASTSTASLAARRVIHAIPKRPPGSAVRAALEAPLRVRAPIPAGRARLPARTEGYSVLLVTVDSLRADAIFRTPASKRYLDGGETPFLDAWLPKTLRFVNAYASGPVTLESMYSVMRGTSVSDRLGGADIPLLARAAGLSTAAVVPWFFGKNEDYGARIDTFDRVEVYDLDEQKTQIDSVDAVLAELTGERFFVWTHFFCAHLPYCGEGKPLSHGLKSPFEVVALGREYREAVRWLDSQMAHMMATLERTGRAGSTIVVLGSDHGEHLGEGLVMGHGDGLHDLDVRVPLVMYVPGMDPGDVQALTANAQILPTLFELLGQRPRSAHTVPSLVPEMQSKAVRAETVVYAKGVAAKQHAVISQDHVDLYDEATAVISTHPRPPGFLPGVVNDLDLGPAGRAAAATRVVRGNPEAFFGARHDERTVSLLAARLSEVTDLTHTEDLDLLLRLGAHLRVPSLTAPLERAYLSTPSPERRARTAALLMPLDRAGWTARLSDLLAASLRRPEEGRVLGALGEYGLVEASRRPDLLGRASEVGDGGSSEACAAWLELFGSGTPGAWGLPAVRGLATGCVGREGGRDLLPAAFWAVSRLELTPAERDGEEAARLAAWALPHLDSTDRRARLGACQALGAVAPRGAIPRLTAVADRDPSIAVRQTARKALNRIEGRR